MIHLKLYESNEDLIKMLAKAFSNFFNSIKPNLNSNVEQYRSNTSVFVYNKEILLLTKGDTCCVTI